jgi:hypothetical protein
VANFTAVYDACVFYPAQVRDLLMRVALSDLFKARWTEEIHSEWMRNLQANRPDLDPARIQRTRALIDASVPDCLVLNYQSHIPNLTLPDPKDRHVLAAAIQCHAGVIVTFNLVDFPASVLAPFGMTAQHPDEFIAHLFDLDPGCVLTAVHAMRQQLKNPPLTAEELLGSFLKSGLIETVRLLSPMSEML